MDENYKRPYLFAHVGRTLIPTTKRKAFFSFHYDDIMRVNVVRNAWKIDHPDALLAREIITLTEHS
jgi:hypothetical protein